MADLTVLIRLHKHELDEKRRTLAALYGDLALLEQERSALQAAFEAEKKSVEEMNDTEMHFSFVKYADTVKKKREYLLGLEAEIEKRIEAAKESLMETFGELKKYEMTQEERDRIELEERRIREGRMMDEIGLEGFRRKDKED